MKLPNIFRSINVYPLWSSTVAGLWYPWSCVAAQLCLQSHSPPSDLRVGVVCRGGFYVPLLGIEIIDGGSCGVIFPPDSCKWRSDCKGRDRFGFNSRLNWILKKRPIGDGIRVIDFILSVVVSWCNVSQSTWASTPLVLEHLIVVNEMMVFPPLVCLGLLARLLNMVFSVSMDDIAG